MAWTLDIIGHERWSYLNGGIHSWHAAGLPLEAGNGRSLTARNVALTLNLAPVAEVADVLIAIDDPRQIIWDVRSSEEFNGTKVARGALGTFPAR